MAIQGARRPLTEADLPEVANCVKTATIAKLAEERWDAECKAHGNDAKIWRIFWQAGEPFFTQGCLLLVFSGVMNAMARPLVLMYAVRALDPAIATMEAAYAYAAALGLVLWLENWSKWRGMQLCTSKPCRTKAGGEIWSPKNAVCSVLRLVG